jgi:hypothetical protein
MPYYYPPLELWTRPGDAEAAARLPEPETGAPRRFEEAGKIFNGGLLAGELLGAPVSEALRIIEETFDLPDSVPHLYFEDELPVLAAVLSDVLERLRSAIDEEGRPVGPGGAVLARSPLFEPDTQGRMRIRSGRYRLDDLAGDLKRLREFLTYAIQHDVLVRVIDAPEDPEGVDREV